MLVLLIVKDQLLEIKLLLVCIARLLAPTAAAEGQQLIAAAVCLKRWTPPEYANSVIAVPWVRCHASSGVNRAGQIMIAEI